MRPDAAPRFPAPLLFLVSGLSMYVGAAFATGVFDRIGAPAVGWWRASLAAVVLVIWRRPWRRRWTGPALAWAAAFGVVLATMNIAFYTAIDHLPLGVVVALEFAGPVTVAAVAGRGWRERGAIVPAAGGVLLLAWATLTKAGASDGGWLATSAGLGLLAALGAAACWAGYIVLGKRASRTGAGIDALAVGMAAGSLAWAPVFAGTTTEVAPDLRLLGALVLVAVMSSVVPYVLDQLVLRRVGTATFAVLTALLPATAVVVGAVALGQVPTWQELGGLVLVSGAIVMTARAR